MAAGFAAFALVLLAFSLRAQALAEGSAEVMSPWQVVHGGNNPWSDGYYRPLRLAKDLELERPNAGPDFAHQIHRGLGRAAGYAPSEADHQWRDLSLAFASTYPHRFATILGYKALALGQHVDFHDNAFAVQLEQGLARWPLLPTWLLLPLGAAGLLLGFGRLSALALLAAAQIAVCILFYTSARFRLPMLPALVLGLAVLVTQLRPRVLRWRAIAAAALAIALFAVFLAPWPPGPYEARAAALEQQANHAYQKAELPLAEQRFLGAQSAIAEALFIAPWLHEKLPVAGLPLPIAQMAARLVPRARGDVASNPHDVWLWFRLGKLCELAHEDRGAIQAYKSLIQHAEFPRDELLAYLALLGQGIAAQRSGDPAAARSAFHKATEQIPGAVEALVALANLGDQAALAAAEHVNPRFEVRYQRGRWALDAGVPAAAIAPLADLLKGVPGYARARMLYAVALFGVGRVEEAVVQAERAQRQVPALVDAIYRLTPLMEAAAQRSNRPGDWLRLAEFAEHDGDLPAALRAWATLEKAAPLRAEDLARVGWMLLRHEDRPNARLWFERALRQQPQLPEARAGLQRLMQRPGN